VRKCGGGGNIQSGVGYGGGGGGRGGGKNRGKASYPHCGVGDLFSPIPFSSGGFSPPGWCGAPRGPRGRGGVGGPPPPLFVGGEVEGWVGGPGGEVPPEGFFFFRRGDFYPPGPIPPGWNGAPEGGVPREWGGVGEKIFSTPPLPHPGGWEHFIFYFPGFGVGCFLFHPNNRGVGGVQTIKPPPPKTPGLPGIFPHTTHKKNTRSPGVVRGRPPRGGWGVFFFSGWGKGVGRVSGVGKPQTPTCPRGHTRGVAPACVVGGEVR
jgi:hypothetical protein